MITNIAYHTIRAKNNIKTQNSFYLIAHVKYHINGDQINKTDLKPYRHWLIPALIYS